MQRDRRRACSSGTAASTALVNNAGGQFPAPLADISAKGWDAVVRNNLTGGFLVARECYTQWMEAHGGAIVNIIADMWHGMPGMGHSGAARAGMLNFTETAALEWARRRARQRGGARLDRLERDRPNIRRDGARTIREHARARAAATLGTESEVSAAIVFLLSPAAAFISGACLRVDGAVPNTRAPPGRHRRQHRAFDGFHLARGRRCCRTI